MKLLATILLLCTTATLLHSQDVDPVRRITTIGLSVQADLNGPLHKNGIGGAIRHYIPTPNLVYHVSGEYYNIIEADRTGNPRLALASGVGLLLKGSNAKTVLTTVGGFGLYRSTLAPYYGLRVEVLPEVNCSHISLGAQITRDTDQDTFLTFGVSFGI